MTEYVAVQVARTLVNVGLWTEPVVQSLHQSRGREAVGRTGLMILCFRPAVQLSRLSHWEDDAQRFRASASRTALSWLI